MQYLPKIFRDQGPRRHCSPPQYVVGLGLLPDGRSVPVGNRSCVLKTSGPSAPTEPKPDGADVEISASPESVPKNGRLPALVWKIHLLHGAQTRLVQNAAITGDAPGTLSRLGTERIQGQCAALPEITQEIPVGLQACHGGQRGKPGRGGPGILLRL